MFSRAVFLGKEPKKKPADTSKEGDYPEIPSDVNNPRVRRFIREYAYNSRETMKTYLARSQTYLPMVKAMAREHGVPEDISYLFLLGVRCQPRGTVAGQRAGDVAVHARYGSQLWSAGG